ncbi:ABC transporter permease [Entomoplasma freundtii]|nr:ABC transporter permease [Entomoplasma freundtii]
MSRKRIIKFIGISLVPIIYGVVCMVAFWNPISNIGKAPMAIMDLDHKIILVKHFDNSSDSSTLEDENVLPTYKLGALINPNGPGEENTDFGTDEEIFDYVQKIQNGEAPQQLRINSDPSNPITYSADNTDLAITSLWDVFKAMLLPKTNEAIPDTEYTFKTAKIGGEIALTNIHYLKNSSEIKDQWQGSRYYVQAKIPKDFSASFFGWLGTVINHWPAQDNLVGDQPHDWKEILKPLEFWTTFERNFIFGYYMQTFETFASGLIYKAIPNLFTSFLTGDLMNKLLINGEDLKDLNDPAVNPEIPGFNVNDNYFMLRTGKADSSGGSTDINWIANHENLTPYSLFGALEKDGKYEKGKVGGQLLKSFQNIDDLKTSGVINIIKKVLPGASADLVEFIVNTISKLLDDVKDNEMVNATLYQIVTGQWNYNGPGTENKSDLVQADLQDELNSRLWDFFADMGFNTGDPVELHKQLTIFPTDDNLTGSQFAINGVGNEQEFNTQINSFMENNPNTFHGLIGLDKWPAAIAGKLVDNLTGDIRPRDLLKWTIQGSKNSLYGIGLGQFFLVIGLWIGVLMQTFVFDRAKRVTKATASQWYLSKTMLMGTVVILQATIEIWVAYACGFHQIGASAMCFLWLWFMASGLMFVFIIQGLWFSVKDETIGKFMAIIIMVLSLAAGGGTFPAFAQFGFFHAISYIVPFTYVLRGTGAIIYGVSLNGTTPMTTNVILSNWAPYFLFIAIFLFIGLGIGAPHRYKEMNWGSYRGYKVTNALLALGQNPDKMGFRVVKFVKANGKKVYRYNWDALKPGFDMPLYLKCRQMYPFEGRFKWWEKKHHDVVQRPNWSDEDIMSRNE